MRRKTDIWDFVFYAFIVSLLSIFAYSCGYTELRTIEETEYMIDLEEQENED
jgi:hypothetical protein